MFDYTPKELYKLFRLNRTFTRLINVRRKGLSFNLADIPPEIFFQSLRNAQKTLKSLKVLVNIKHIKKRDLEHNLFRPTCLVTVDLRKLDLVSEIAMQRIIDHSRHTLQSFSVSSKNQALTSVIGTRLALCPNLKVVEFAQ